MRRAPAVLWFLLLASAPPGRASRELTWAEVFRDLATPSVIVPGARELPGETLSQIPISGDMLSFYTAREMEDDVDEFTSSLWGETYGARLRTLLAAHVSLPWPALERFLLGRKREGFEEVLVAREGLLVFHYVDADGRSRNLLVPTSTGLYDEVARLYELPIPDTSDPFLGLLDGMAVPEPPGHAYFNPLSATPTFQEFRERTRRLGASLHALSSIEAEDVRFLSAIAPSRMASLVVAVGIRARDDRAVSAALEQLVTTGGDEDAALAALVLAEQAPRVVAWHERAARGLAEPRLVQFAALTLCAARSRGGVGSDALGDETSRRLAAAFCGESSADARDRTLGQLLGEGVISPQLHGLPVRWTDARRAAFFGAIEESLRHPSPGLSDRLLGFLTDPTDVSHDGDDVAGLLRSLLRDPAARRLLPHHTRPSRPSEAMRELLQELAVSPSPEAASWAALALEAAGDRSPALWEPLASGLSVPELHDECVLALDRAHARDRAGFKSFVRGLRRSGDPTRLARAIILRLSVLSELDRKELSESLPLVVRGLADPSSAIVAMRALDQLYDVEAQEAVHMAIARQIEHLGPAERMAAVAYLLGRGRGTPETLDRALRVTVRALDDPRLRPAASKALERALAMDAAPFVRDVLLRRVASAVDAAAEEAAAILAGSEIPLSLADAGMVVRACARSLEGETAPRARSALRKLALGPSDEARYWLWLLSRDSIELRHVMAQAGV